MLSPLDILSIESWILLITAIVVLRYYIHGQWKVFEELGIPHDPPSIWTLGNFGTIMKNPTEFFKDDLEQKKKFGKIYGTYGGFEPHITIWDPELLKEIQIKQFSAFPDRQRAVRKLQGKEMNTALTLVTGEQWKRIRHTLTPAFSTSKLKEMFGIIGQCTDHLVENLTKSISKHGGKFDTKEAFGKLSMDVLCSAAFGVNVHSQDEGKEAKVVEVSKKLFSTAFFANPIALLAFLSPTFEKILEFFKYNLFPREITTYYASLIDAMIKKKGSADFKERVDILKCMLDCEQNEDDLKSALKGLSRSEIVGNSMIMILAGYETTSGVMQFLAYNIASYKSCQEKLRQEIKDAVENHGGLNYEALKSMKYLMMCINETMRLYPALVRNSRLCEEEIAIKRLKIPKGSIVDIPVYGLTRDPEYWDEPLEFKPERMEDMSKIDPMIFQPFGVGPRNCIGMRFALVEVKMAICKILLNFRLDTTEDTPNPPLDLVFRGSTRPKIDPINLRVSPITE